MEIAQSLANYDWADIDLIFGQFQLPTSDDWGSDKKSYVHYHLKEVGDKALNELRDYLVGGPSEVTKSLIDSIENKIWVPNRFKLFISHVSEDKALVSDIKEKLKAYGIDCFIAHQDIDPTLEWQNVIESALQSCDALTCLLTKNFHKSFWTDQEIGFCVARRVLIIPLKVDIDPYGFIGKYQALNCAKFNSSHIAESIFEILVESPLASAKLAEAIVEDFVESPTWEAARARSLLLPKLKTWTPELLRKLENSLETNSHIPSAFGVPQRIKGIIESNSQ
jgi:hypothetical protein